MLKAKMKKSVKMFAMLLGDIYLHKSLVKKFQYY